MIGVFVKTTVRRRGDRSYTYLSLVEAVRVNGKNLQTPFLPYAEFKNGGTLNFVMGPNPSRWGTDATGLGTAAAR